MTDWISLLQLLADGPRENGTPALHEVAVRLHELLRSLGLDASLFSYTAHPLRLRLAGAVIFAGSSLYAALLYRGWVRTALAVAIMVPVVALTELDYYVPIFGWIGATTEEHIEAVVPAADESRHLILAAHFDSKTDLLDHVERAPVELLGVPIGILMIVTAALQVVTKRRPRRLVPTALVLAPLYGAATFASLTAGEWVSARSHGALDDGAACAVLVRLGERLHADPPRHLGITLLFLSGEEIGVHGSWVYTEKRYEHPPPMPTSMVNLEFIGAAPDLGVFHSERFSLRSYPPDPHLLAVADATHRTVRGKPIYVPWYGGATDARSFLAHGIPALTLFSDPPGHPIARHMHSAADTRAALDVAALDSTLDFLEAMVRAIDRNPGSS